MSDANIDNQGDNSATSRRSTKPSLAQLKIIVEFIKKHPQLSQRKNKDKKLWSELTNMVNAVDGTLKSTKGWIKYWADKKRHVQLKYEGIQQGEINEELCSLEQQILQLGKPKVSVAKKRKKAVEEPKNIAECNDVSVDGLFCKEDDLELSRLKDIELSLVRQTEERHTNIMEKIVDAMDQQASSIAQIAQASLVNAKALEKVSESAHFQAMSIERLSHRFVDISTSVQDVRNSLININFTIKRFYPTQPNNERNNSTFFS